MKSVTKRGSSVYAGFFRRFMAYTIDGMFISIITTVFQSALGQNPLAALSLIDKPDQLAVMRAQPAYVISQIGVYVIYALYLIVFWTSYDGATPGKRFLGIKIVREDGERIGIATALVRLVGMVLSAFPFLLGYLWAIWDGKKQAWHDKLARTYVIRTDTKPNPAGIIMFIIALLYMIFMVGSTAAAAFIAARSVINQRNSTEQAVKSFKSVDNLPPEAKKHYERSKELFVQMRASATDRAAVIRLNDENISELKKAIDEVPDNARLWTDLGSAYTWISSKGQLTDGLAAYGKAEELEPTNVIYVSNVGDMLIRLEKYDDAVLQLQKALRMDNNYAQPEYLIGVAYRNLKIYPEAKSHLARAVEIWKNGNDSGQFDDDILMAQRELSQIPQ